MKKSTYRGYAKLSRVLAGGLALGLGLGLARAAELPIRMEAVAPYGQNFFTPFLNSLGLSQSHQVFLVAVPPGSPIVGGGLALDKAGNVYVSHFGLNPDEGAILTIPSDGRPPVFIMRGFDRPSDIEISPDGRSLLIAQPDGQLVRKYFGVSIRPLHQTGLPASAVAIMRTDHRQIAVRQSADGYFHFPDVLVPLQQRTTFDLFIQFNEIRFSFFDLKFQTVSGKLEGQTIMDLAF